LCWQQAAQHRLLFINRVLHAVSGDRGLNFAAILQDTCSRCTPRLPRPPSPPLHKLTGCTACACHL
jgi:hypothetical protein